MSTQLTLNLPDGLVERVEAVAHRTGRSVNDFLAETIELTLRPWGEASSESLSKPTDIQDLELREKRPLDAVKTDALGYPTGYFTATSGSFAGEPLDVPPELPQQRREAW